jgi:hypothetical protein
MKMRLARRVMSQAGDEDSQAIDRETLVTFVVEDVPGGTEIGIDVLVNSHESETSASGALQPAPESHTDSFEEKTAQTFAIVLYQPSLFPALK